MKAGKEAFLRVSFALMTIFAMPPSSSVGAGTDGRLFLPSTGDKAWLLIAAMLGAAVLGGIILVVAIRRRQGSQDTEHDDSNENDMD